MKPRLVFYCVLLALPALALCAAGACFLVDKVPKLERSEKAALTRQYREVAEDLVSGERKPDGIAPRQKGWRQTSRIAKSIPWGHVPSPEGELVWAGTDPNRVALALVPPDDALDESTYLRYGVPVVLALFVVMTAFGIWFFVRSAKARDDFLAATAHDLTTPLVAMRRLIGRDDEYALVMSEQMLRLVQNVTDFLRLGGKRRAPKIERFSVGSVFFEAYHVFAEDFAEESSGEVKVVGDTGTEIAADRLLTVQILWNLLGNDLKYAAPHGSVEFRIVPRDHFVDLILADNGPGMSSHQRRHAFDRYYRARTVLASGKGGFGIGLCTAREFSRAMGGDLTLAPNTPNGCVFTLSLPKGF